MRFNFLYRNVRARDNLELFLVSSVSSLLLIRFFLHVTDYPQLGGEGFHIAHMLYGGLFMAAALILTISFIGYRVQRLSAFVGGIGFGIFIDELGKFITSDNDYFFRPTIGIIYAIFIILYLLINFLGRYDRLSKREYELNALEQFEEAVLRDMDEVEKSQIKALLRRADHRSPVTQELVQLLDRIETVPTPEPRIVRRFLHKMDLWYRRFWKRRESSHLIAGIFLFEALLFLLAVFVSVFSAFHSVDDLLQPGTYGQVLIIGQLLSSMVAGGFALDGAFKLAYSREFAFEQFKRATLINLFLTEFFIFARVEFDAIPSFALNLVLLWALRYSLYQERRKAAHVAATSQTNQTS
jgi:hypothetical protein